MLAGDPLEVHAVADRLPAADFPVRVEVDLEVLAAVIDQDAVDADLHPRLVEITALAEHIEHLTPDRAQAFAKQACRRRVLFLDLLVKQDDVHGVEQLSS